MALFEAALHRGTRSTRCRLVAASSSQEGAMPLSLCDSRWHGRDLRSTWAPRSFVECGAPPTRPDRPATPRSRASSVESVLLLPSTCTRSSHCARWCRSSSIR